MTEPTLRAPEIRTFELIQYVSGFLDGELKDWPANIQDVVLEAMARKSDEVKLPLTVIASGCEFDDDPECAPEKKFWVKVLLSEIVVVDMRSVEGTLH